MALPRGGEWGTERLKAISVLHRHVKNWSLYICTVYTSQKYYVICELPWYVAHARIDKPTNVLHISTVYTQRVLCIIQSSSLIARLVFFLSFLSLCTLTLALGSFVYACGCLHSFEKFITLMVRRVPSVLSWVLLLTPWGSAAARRCLRLPSGSQSTGPPWLPVGGEAQRWWTRPTWSSSTVNASSNSISCCIHFYNYSVQAPSRAWLNCPTAQYVDCGPHIVVIRVHGRWCATHASIWSWGEWVNRMSSWMHSQFVLGLSSA